jgi:hypothetical protein
MEAALLGPSGRIVLGSGIVTIGRVSDNRLVVNHPTASSQHAEIRPGFNGYTLTDLGSTNGTFVNEQPLAPHFPRLLQSGDRIRIGDTTFLYEAGRSDFPRRLVQDSSYQDVPTERVSAIKYIAMNHSERFGDQMAALYSSSPPQQQPISPVFTPAFQQGNTPPCAMERATGYDISKQQPSPAPFLPAFQQPDTPRWATERETGSGMPEQLQPYAPPAPVQPKSKHRLTVLLIVLSVILVLGAGGGGVTVYLLTRPQPVMSVTSAYEVGSTPAGATGTVLHVSARSFSGSSVITFLLDNAVVARNRQVSSEAKGTVKADLLITAAWPVGTHKLTAKDAGGYMTKVGAPVVIVPQGQAHTPGPNGAPADDMSFTLQVSVHPHDAGTGKQLDSYTETLSVLGKPDPSGGTVCQDFDDGLLHIYIGDVGNGITYRATDASTCSGTYKGGKLTYIETATSEKEVYSDGTSCQEHTPYVLEHLEGTFTSQNTISGTLSSDSVTTDCNGSTGPHQFIYNADKGSWTAQL